MDLQSLHGKVAGQSVNYVAPAARHRLALQINGSGSVNPLTDGQALVIGTDYTLQAIPRPANLFSNWIVAGIVVINPTLHFTMVSNLVITANFVTNGFLPAIGSYNGLVYETQGVRHPSSGFFTLNLANSGTFSGSVALDGGRHPFSGRLDLTGHSQIVLKRDSKSALTLALELNAAEKEIHGTLSDGNWVAELTVYHVFASASDPAAAVTGAYTLVIPGSDATAGALGDSFATLRIDASGTIRLAGTLADGTAFTRAVKIFRDGMPSAVPSCIRRPDAALRSRACSCKIKTSPGVSFWAPTSRARCYSSNERPRPGNAASRRGEPGGSRGAV
ncbi:MAG TPA: hypothetical protein VNT26_22005 [Candidatus Sulfotelmatobacter sp.]|nr:hypothetical protein [Candidatus Sulfotelmatobacter sp.]